MPAWSKPKFRRVTGNLALLAIASIGAAGCPSDSESFTGPVVSIIVQVLPIGTTTTELARGITRQLRAVPVNADKNWVDTPVTWSSSDNARATVDGTGLVTTRGGGVVTITAATGGQTGTFDLAIQYPVGTIAIGGGGVTIRREAAVALTATVTGTNNQPALGRTLVWTSSNPAVATVSSAGFVSGLTDGVVTITATSEGVSGTTTVTVSGAPVIATVTVTPAPVFAGVGETVQLSRVERAGSGTIVVGTPAAWTTSAAGVATVHPTSGLVTVVGAGSATITATVNNGVGVNVTGTATFLTAPALAKGVGAIPPAILPGKVFLYAYIVPAGATSFTVTGGGGAGDGDIYIFAPGVIPSALDESGNALAYSNSTGFSAASGNGEFKSFPAPAAGTWRIYIQAWAPAGPVSGMTITATHAP